MAYACARYAKFFDGGIVHLPDVVAVWTSGINNRFCFDLKSASIQFVNAMNSRDFAARFLKVRESSVVENHTAVLCGCHCEAHVGACIIVLAVVIHNTAW